MSDGGSAWMNSTQRKLSLLSRRWDWLRSGSTKLIHVTKSDQKRNSPYLIKHQMLP
jgi:hypothetical protein